jgi:acyl-CoA thioester hydrolase
MSGRARPPEVNEVLDIPATVRTVAPPEWEDLNGHVTVTRYYELHMQSVALAFERWGWTQDYVVDGASLFSVEQHLHFFGEVLVGQEVSTHVRLLDRTAKFAHGVSMLVNHSTGRVANTVEFTEGHVDLTSRRTTPIREEFAGTLDRVLAEHRSLPWAVPLDPRMVPVRP